VYIDTVLDESFKTYTNSGLEEGVQDATGGGFMGELPPQLAASSSRTKTAASKHFAFIAFTPGLASCEVR
jgi:hypothetical protein